MKAARRRVQVPAARVADRRAAEGCHRQDPQARDRDPGGRDRTGGAVMRPTGATAGSGPDGPPEAAAALDMLLTQAALGPLRRFFPGRAGAQVRPGAGRPAGTAWRRGRAAWPPSSPASPAVPRPSPPARGTAGSPTPPGRATRCCAGSCRPTSRPGTRRSASSATTPLDWRDAERLRFAVSNLVDALAPSNSPLLSPEAWKAAIDTGGGSLRDRGQAPGQRPVQRAARARDGAAGRLHGRHRPGGDPRARSCCAPRCSS